MDSTLNHTKIEEIAQRSAERLRNGEGYTEVMAGQMLNNMMQPEEWVAIIRRTETLRKIPTAPTEERLIVSIMEVLPVGTGKSWPELTIALASRTTNTNWLTVRKLLNRLTFDGVLQKLHRHKPTEHRGEETWKRLR